MGSVNSNTNGDLFSASVALPTPGGAHAFQLWIKPLTYTSGRSVIDFSFAGDAAALRIAFGNGTVGALTELIVVWQQQGATQFFFTVIASGSYSDWIYAGVSHTNASTSVDVDYRKQGAPLTAAVITGCSDMPGIVVPYSVNKIFDDETLAPAPNVSARSYKVWLQAKTLSDFTAESQLLDTLSSATNIFTFLDLDSITNAGTDLSGAGHNYTVENTLANDASQPNVAILSGNSMFFGCGSVG